MFYTPKFCCHCGEKIERPQKSFTDSGRFCDVCKHDFVWQRFAPKGFIALMALVGIFGVGSYWRSGEKPLNVSARQFTDNPANSGKTAANRPPQVSPNSNVQQSATANNVQVNGAQTPGLTSKKPVERLSVAPVPAEETVYFCGAPTKKGTPCSRRVRGGGRCWQHTGQAALLPPEKLLANQ